MRSFLLVAGILTATPASVHAEFCGAMGLEARVISETAIVLPGDGGLLVAAMPGFGRSDQNPADQSTWRFQTGGVATEPRRMTLAPGLVVYRARQDGMLTLVDADGKPRATTFVTRRPRPRLPAPVIAWTLRSPNQVAVNVRLDDLPPEGAIAIVLVGKDGQARSWDFVDPELTVQRVYKQPGCETQPPGTRASISGEEVTFFYVDAYGRASARSKTSKIVDQAPSDRLSR